LKLNLLENELNRDLTNFNGTGKFKGTEDNNNININNNINPNHSKDLSRSTDNTNQNKYQELSRKNSNISESNSNIHKSKHTHSIQDIIKRSTDQNTTKVIQPMKRMSAEKQKRLELNSFEDSIKSNITEKDI